MAVSVGPETVILLHRPKRIRRLFKQLCDWYFFVFLYVLLVLFILIILYHIYLQILYMGIVLFGPGIALEAGR